VALLSAQQAVITGTTPSYVAVAASDTIVPDDRAFLIVKNASGSADTCTVVIPGSTYGQARPDVAITVPATTGERWIGPFTPDMADPVTGFVTVTHSQTASVTCALVRV
jgi:hypothetical protein